MNVGDLVCISFDLQGENFKIDEKDGYPIDGIVTGMPQQRIKAVRFNDFYKVYVFKNKENYWIDGKRLKVLSKA